MRRKLKNPETFEGISLYPCASGDLAVYLGLRRAGTIISVDGGFAYVPAGKTLKDRGEVYPTVFAVIDTL